jgi:hypothetical protein
MLSPDYIVGLTDGEGSFNVYIRPPKKKYGAKNHKVECHYYIKLRDDDRPLLEKVKKFFGSGRVVFQRENRPNHHHMYRFEVSNLKELQNLIIPFFDRYKLQSKRINDFELFKKIIRAVLNKEHLTRKGFRKVQQWKSKMHGYWTR